MNEHDQYSEIIELLVENIESVLKHFDIEYSIHEDIIRMACPVHSSDNPESLTLYLTGHTISGNWACWSHACESEILLDSFSNGETIERERGRDIFGFIRGVLAEKKDRHVEYSEAIHWAKEFLGYESKAIEHKDTEQNTKRDFVRSVRILLKEREEQSGEISREEIRQSLTIPAQHFLGRGFQKETLDRYDVGFCEKRGEQMYNRVVVPIYDDNYKFVIGRAGRTIKPKCAKCNWFHYPDESCPKNRLERYLASKWINSKGFKSSATLYNIWFARKHIEEQHMAILVEGKPDTWKLEEAGIHIGLGLFGSSLTEEQKIILDSSGALTLLILTDADEAGLKARNCILQQCKRSYNCVFIDLPKNDIGDMTVEQVQHFLGPTICRNKF